MAFSDVAAKFDPRAQITRDLCAQLDDAIAAKGGPLTSPAEYMGFVLAAIARLELATLGVADTAEARRSIG